MKFELSSVLALAATAIAAPAMDKSLAPRAVVKGFDISHYQATVNYAAAYNTGGLRFAMVKATEGTTYKDPKFTTHYNGLTNAGFIRGGYHFANPSSSPGSGAAQASFFYKNGGGWTNDGITLPGMLDMEAGSSKCWGLSASQMVTWINDFVTKYHSLSTRYPIIYTSPDWWKSCTGNSNAFINKSPLDMAQWSSSPGTPPGGWPYWTFWQNADTNPYGGDSDQFNGDMTQLKKMATG
ncbi:glycoside hydrolase family 25 protein [Aulographum hederae CBS 113979]|uniref:N,O-diacetylmuramidase n=1 Tax=Aulographum hederae CBS 113979 TaxID=1176131 RepID=A0A6G1GKA8_9PEZI|nr:glycoside hydrolase family 25 protein [Aulographum hederae CBS 113979]